MSIYSHDTRLGGDGHQDLLVVTSSQKWTLCPDPEVYSIEVTRGGETHQNVVKAENF